MAIRFYNSTPRDILSVNYDIYARYLKPGNKALTNTKVDINGRGIWPVAMDRVPFTAYAKTEIDKNERICLICGDKKVPIDEIKEVLVLAKGTFKDTSSEVYDSHTYTLPKDKDHKEYSHVDVIYGEDPKTWVGWPSFDD